MSSRLFCNVNIVLRFLMNLASISVGERLPTLAYIVHPSPRVSKRTFIYLILYLFSFYIYLISRIIVDR